MVGGLVDSMSELQLEGRGFEPDHRHILSVIRS